MLNPFLKPAVLLLLISLPLWFLYRMIALRKQEDVFHVRQEFYWFLLYAYFVCLAAFTIVPLRFTRYNNVHTRGLNLVPIKNTWHELSAILAVHNDHMVGFAMQNIIGNIALFIPLGILLPLSDRRNRRWLRAFLICLSISVMIESIQWISRQLGFYRSVDIDDVILNALGGLTGYLLFKTVSSLHSDRKKSNHV
ncbi:MAG: VanZ family protein [Chitinophagaceae bacterium]|nr:VanZ family protein [Chitinophagaceae bacterium]